MKSVIRIVILSVVMILALSACGLFQEPEEASGTIEAIPLEIATATPGSALAEVGEETEGAAEEATAYPAPEDDGSAQEAGGSEAYPPPPPTDDGTEAYPPPPPPPADSETEAYPAPEDAGDAAGDLRIYQISQADSEVRFELDEDLRGQRKTVIGVTDQVAGEIALNLADLSTTQVGVIQINARTLATDNNFRNRAIQNEILETGSYEFITFSPTSIQGLPASATMGEEVEFVVAGDLTIRDITNPVQFFVTATAVSEDQLMGTANASVFREDFGLQIPSVPNVANVEEEVELYIDFVANAQ